MTTRRLFSALPFKISASATGATTTEVNRSCVRSLLFVTITELFPFSFLPSRLVVVRYISILPNEKIGWSSDANKNVNLYDRNIAQNY